MKLFYKYSLILAALLLLAVGSVTGLALRHHRQGLTREALLRADSIAVNLALVSAEAILTRNVLQLVPLSMDATTRHENVVYAAVTDKDHVVLAHPDREAVKKPFELKVLGREAGYGLQSEVSVGQAMGRLVWDVSVPVKAKGSLVELGRVHVGLDKRTLDASVGRSLRQLLLVSMLCLALGLAVAFYAIGYVVRPLQVLSSASQRVGQGDLGVQVDAGGRDELGQLAGNFNAMVRGLKLAEERRREASRIESELEVARRIQEGLLPTERPMVPGFELAFFCRPAKELGGDYYDWYPVDGGRKVGLCIADVSGKGVPAALHMTNLRNLFRFTTASIEAPLEVLKRVNDLAWPELRAESFVTLIYGVLDPATGAFRYVNAGHDPLVVAGARGGLVRRLESTAFAVGMVESDEFNALAEEHEVSLGPGDLLFLFTDGVTEAEGRAGGQFGLERISTAVAGRSASQAVEAVTAALEEHLAGLPAGDDITMLAVSRRA